MDKTVLISIPVEDLQTIIIDCVNSCLKFHNQNNPKQIDADEFLTIQQASEFLNLKISTLYGLVHEKKIPVSKPGKHLFFSKLELTEWVQAGRKKTAKELGAEAEETIKSKGKK